MSQENTDQIFMKPWREMHTIASDIHFWLYTGVSKDDMTINIIIYIIYRLRLYPISSYYPDPVLSALSSKG